jgi:hypothetical protein
MKHLSGWRLIIAGVTIVVTVVFLACGMFLYMSFISYPSTKAIGRRYLDAVVNKNLSAAVNLARSNEKCRQVLMQDAELDIEEFGGDQIRRIAIEMQYNDGSDNEIQFALITFEHKESGQPHWRPSSMRLFTNHDVPGFRYLCGNLYRDS